MHDRPQEQQSFDDGVVDVDDEWFDSATTQRSATAEAKATAREAAIRPTSMRIVETVAQKRGVDPTTLEPLYEAIDPDSLDALFPPSPQRSEVTSRSLTFTYAGYQVTIEGAGVVDVTELDERERVADTDTNGVDETTSPTD